MPNQEPAESNPAETLWIDHVVWDDGVARVVLSNGAVLERLTSVSWVKDGPDGEPKVVLEW